MTIIGNIIMPQKVRFFFGGNEPDKGLWFDTAQGGTDQNVGVLKYKDASGNLSVVYPVTKMEAVEGLTTELTGMKNGYLPKSGGSMTGSIAMGGSKITGLAAPSAPADAVTKSYADAKRFTASAALGTDWPAAAPYTQTVPVPGLLETDIPHVAPVYDSDPETALAQREAWSMVCQADAGTDSLTFTCFEDCPGAAVPIQIEVMR